MIHEKIEIQLKDSEFKANLFTYFLDNSPEIDLGRKRPVVLICPGGGYEMTSDREAEALAVKFMAMGYHAAILRYSVAPARFPEALLQLATAVAMLRENAEKWHIDTVLINQIILEKAGLKKENIIDSKICSVCNPDLIHSYRVEKEGYGLSTALIEIK